MGRRGGGSEARKRDATECRLDAHRGRFGQEDEARDDVLSLLYTRMYMEIRISLLHTADFVHATRSEGRVRDIAGWRAVVLEIRTMRITFLPTLGIP